MPVIVNPERRSAVPYLEENLWGYGKRLRFVDGAMQREFAGTNRRELRVLDVGCGNGSQLAIPLAESGYAVLGIDPHLPSIERGRSLSPLVEFVHGTVDDLPPATFDCVIVSEVLEHLTAPEDLLRKALCHVSPSGLFIATVPNGHGEFELDRRLYQHLQIDKLVARLRMGFGARQSDQSASSEETSPHVQQFSRTRLKEMFARNNLLLMQTRATSFASGPLIAHSLGKSRNFVRLNAAIADCLPLSLAGGWMFCLRRAR